MEPVRSSSFIIPPGTDLEDRIDTRQKLWEFTKEISNLRIKLESEQKRNSHLEENYLKLPATLESLQEARNELETFKSHSNHLEKQLKESQASCSKYKKDLELFKEDAFHKFREHDLATISQSSKIRTLENEQSAIRSQCQKLLEEYEAKVKRLKTFKQKYRTTKEQLKQLKRTANSTKLDTEFLEVKLELEGAKRKITDLTRSREELAKRCSDLEDKNNYLNSQKSDLKAAAHRRDRTMVDLEKDFKITLEGIESKQSEEVQELNAKVSLLERQIKEIKKTHEDALSLKEEEKMIEKDKTEDIKKQMERLAKDKQRTELELTSCKELLDEANNKIIEVKFEYESQNEFMKKVHKDKIIELKTQISELQQRNKELDEIINISRKSVYQGPDSLADELGQLEVRDSTLMPGFQSFFRPNSETEKTQEKLKKTKEKKKQLKKDLNNKSEQLIENERILTQNEKTIRNLNSDISSFKDMVSDLNELIKRLESEKELNKSELAKVASLNSELLDSNRELKEKNSSLESEMSRQKSDLEERILALKKKYSDKILKYKEDILDLTQNSAKLRDNLSTTKTLNESQASELESFKKLLKKNNKLKEKKAGMKKALKTSTETINKLQAKLTELYKIPNIEDDLEDKPNANLNQVDEKIGSDLDLAENSQIGEKIADFQQKNESLQLKISQMIDDENKYKQKITDLENKVNDLTKMLSTEKEVLVINKPNLSDFSSEISISHEKSQKSSTRTFETQALESFTKKVQKLAKELNFSIETVNSSVLFPPAAQPELSLKPESSLSTKPVKTSKKDSLDSSSEENDQQNPVPKQSLSETTQVYLFSLSPAKSSSNQDLEVEIFRLQQDLSIKTERFQKLEKEFEDRLNLYEEKIKSLEDERQQYTYVTNTEPDECTDSEDENSVRHGKQTAVSIIDDYQPMTDGSVLETEDDFRNPFDVFKESILLMKSAESDNAKIAELETEVAEKTNQIRVYQEEIKELNTKLAQIENFNNNLQEKNKKLEEVKQKNDQMQKRTPAVEKIHDCVLQEAKMTLLEAHNQRLETELIVSKTNWGEMTNTLIKDINEMEKKLKTAEDDYRCVTEEKDELIRRINQPTKKESRWKIFSRKKRNSDIN